MKYFLDTEFIEGFHKPLFGKRRHFIDLISIGIVAEDGRKYYAISTEFNERKANDWVKENVIDVLTPGLVYRHEPHIAITELKKLSPSAIKKLYGKNNIDIAKEIIEFVNPGWLGIPCDKADPRAHSNSTKDFILLHNAKAFDLGEIFDCWFAQPEFYGYYSDYDWVIFCSLFGTMMDLPKGFPMYCRDLKQMLDERADRVGDLLIHPRSYEEQQTMGIKKATFDEKLSFLKSHKDYPKQTNEHNALADARWNFELYKFLQGM